MISRTAEYAVRAMTHLAEHQGGSRTTHQTAQAIAVPAEYLSKVFNDLGRAGFVRSQRGLYGGYRLAGDPAQLLVLDVIEAVSPLKRYHECPRGRTHGPDKLCPLHRLLDEAAEHIETAFRRVTIADLLDDDEVECGRCESHAKLSRARIDRQAGESRASRRHEEENHDEGL